MAKLFKCKNLAFMSIYDDKKLVAIYTPCITN